MKIPISLSKRNTHHLLHKPSITTHLRHISAAPEPPSQTQSIITQLNTTDDWTNLHTQLITLPPQSLIKIAHQFDSSNKALKFFHFINNPSPSLPPSTSMLPLSSLFETVLELAVREDGSVVDLFNLSKELKVSLTPYSAILLIRYFSRVKKVNESLKLFDELDPDVQNINVRNALLDVVLKSENFDYAHQLFDEMLQPNSKCFPNQTTLNTVFPLLLGRIWGKDSERLVDLIPKFAIHGVFPSNIWLTQLITKLCRSYRSDKAYDLLLELMKFGKVESSPCNALLSGLGKERNHEKIKLLLKKMKENDTKPDIVSFGMLVNHLCKARRVDDALDTLKKMKEGSDGISIKPDVIIYNTVIDGLCKVGRQDEGLVLMNEMKSEHNCFPNVITYNCLIDGFCKSGEIERGRELFEQMKNEGMECNVITVNTLVDGMCKHGRIGTAMEFFRKMQEEKGIKGNVVTYSSLISAFCSVNNIEKAKRLFDEMESVGSPDALAYYSLISGLSLAGRPDDASEIASKMKKSGFRMDIRTYNTLLSGFCSRKKTDKAVEILQEMEENEVKPDVVTFNTLISYFGQIGDFQSAHKFFTNMINVGIVPTVVTYGTLIHAYCLAGNINDALNIFEEMLKASKVPPNTVIYNMLIDSLRKCGKIDKALSLLDEMLERGVKPNTTTYNALFKALESANRLSEAFKLMDQMTSLACNPDYVTMEILTGWLSNADGVDKLRKFGLGYEVSSAAITV